MCGEREALSVRQQVEHMEVVSHAFERMAMFSTVCAVAELCFRGRPCAGANLPICELALALSVSWTAMSAVSREPGPDPCCAPKPLRWLCFALVPGEPCT